jgi:hypothetical protein
MNTKLSQRLLLCGSALLAGLGSLFLLRAPAEADRAAAPMEAAAAELPEPGGPTEAGERRASEERGGRGYYTAAIGTRLDYDLDLETTYSLGKDGERVQPMSLRAAGRLALVVVSREDGEIVVAARLGDLQWTVAGQRIKGDDPAWDRQRAATGSRVHLRLGEDGAVRGCRFESGLDGEQRNFVRGLLAPFAFTVPVEPGSSWEATESDATGVYVARYQGHGKPEGFLVRRNKQRYEELAQDQDGVPEHRVEGQAEGLFDRDIGWLCAADVDERLDLAIPGLEVRVHMQQRGRLRLTATSVAAVSGEDLLPADATFVPFAGHREDAGAHADAEAQARRDAELRKLDPEQLLTKLMALLAAEPLDHKSIDEAWNQLAGCLRLDAKKVADLQGRLERGELDPRLGGLVVTAMGAAGTDAAQTALSATRAATGLSVELRETACVAMLQLANPKPELIAGVARDLDAARGLDGLDAVNVRLLGALASRSDAEVVAGRRAVDLLRGLETKAKQSQGTGPWLEALGNSGRPEVVADVMRYTGDADPAVRRAAFCALRTLSGDRVVDTLIGKGLTDSAPEARAESLFSLGEHKDPRAAEAIRRAARDDTDPFVRRTALQAMANRKLAAADHRILDDIANLDQDEQVREFARKLRARR